MFGYIRLSSDRQRQDRRENIYMPGQDMFCIYLHTEFANQFILDCLHYQLHCKVPLHDHFYVKPAFPCPKTEQTSVTGYHHIGQSVSPV